MNNQYKKKARKILVDKSSFKKIETVQVRWHIKSLELYSIYSTQSPFVKPVMVALNKDQSFISRDYSSFTDLLKYFYKEEEYLPLNIIDFIQLFTIFFSSKKVMVIKNELVNTFNKSCKDLVREITKPEIKQKANKDVYSFWIYRFEPIHIEFNVQKTGEFTYSSSVPIEYLLKHKSPNAGTNQTEFSLSKYISHSYFSKFRKSFLREVS